MAISTRRELWGCVAVWQSMTCLSFPIAAYKNNEVCNVVLTKALLTFIRHLNLKRSFSVWWHHSPCYRYCIQTRAASSKADWCSGSRLYWLAKFLVSLPILLLTGLAAVPNCTTSPACAILLMAGGECRAGCAAANEAQLFVGSPHTILPRLLQAAQGFQTSCCIIPAVSRPKVFDNQRLWWPKNLLLRSNQIIGSKQWDMQNWLYPS